MKEKPIIFLGAMVRAILDGTKTMTRRIVKPQPEYAQCEMDKGKSTACYTYPTYNPQHRPLHKIAEGCPYGFIGDHLWVRETWRTTQILSDIPPSHLVRGAPIEYLIKSSMALCDGGKWKP